MAKSIKIPDFGIEVIEGRPGSGKSYFAVERLLEVILNNVAPSTPISL